MTTTGQVFSRGFYVSRSMASLRKCLILISASAAVVFFPTTIALPGMLFPRDTERREVKDLSGMWDFRADISPNRNGGFEQMWFAKPLRQVSRGSVINFSQTILRKQSMTQIIP